MSDKPINLIWREQLKGYWRATVDAPKCLAAVWQAIGGLAWHCEVAVCEKGRTFKRQNSGLAGTTDLAKAAAQAWLTSTLAGPAKAKTSGGVTHGRKR